ncbi:flagellar hook-associated protein FlgK [uncultured Amnibacterium sp.]|uniref:flagellar hook-associated protein FlgK n=1 Tax=uncultured Amnibacterium sp. TaxID=1631851 RepID=UPI0035C95F41
MSTFGGLSIASSGLAAARAALEVTGQNVANANTEGYTRQRVNQSPLAQTALATYSKPNSVGDGVTVTGVARLTDTIVNARVNSTGSAAAYWSTSAAAASTVETSLNEPNSNGLSSQLNKLWSSWQQMANHPGDVGVAGALLSQANVVASTISAGYTAAADAWTAARAATVTAAGTINETAGQIADLNKTIRSLAASGGNVNNLLDQRDAAVTVLSKLTGATSRGNADGTIDVVVGGNTLVSGVTTRKLEVAGTAAFPTSSSATAVSLVWSDTRTAVVLDGGEMAARLASLQGANATATGGVYAEAAQAYNTAATDLASKVNAVHRLGTTSTGAPGTTGTPLDFFGFQSTSGPAATNLYVVPTSVAGIAAADGTKGNLDNTIADKIAQLGNAADSPDAGWATYVSRIGSQSATAAARSATSDTAASAATTAQNSVGGVDLDEETSNLVIYQHAYQASARVISTIADVLDTLINMGAR